MASETPDLKMLQQVMIHAVRVGCRVAVRAQKASQSASGKAVKTDASPVTVGDFAVQACISHILSQAFPETKLLGEEDDEGFSKLSSDIKKDIVARVSEEFPELKDETRVAQLIGRGSFGKLPADKPPCFVLDPIDGTKGFLRGEQYAVCLGYLDADGIPAASVVGCPNMPSHLFKPGESDAAADRGFLFDAVHGGGVRMRRIEKNGEEEILREWSVADNSTEPEAPIVIAESYEKSHTKGNTNHVLFKELSIDDTKNVLRIDSQVKFCALARGDANVYLRFVSFDISTWDVLPGYLLLKESGGRVTDKFGGEINFNVGRTVKSDSLIATRAGMGDVHDRILRMIAVIENHPVAPSSSSSSTL